MSKKETKFLQLFIIALVFLYVLVIVITTINKL